MSGLDGRAFYLVAFLLMAGCTGQGQISTPPFWVPVPTWEPGYRWTYDVTGSTEGGLDATSGPRLESPGLVERWHETVEVFNTAHTLGLENVYFAWLNTQPDGGESDGAHVGSYHDYRPVRVFRASDLAFLATGSILVGGDCEGCNVLRLVEPEEMQPVLRFPLQPGAAWTERATPSSFVGELAVEFEYSVVGLRTVDQGGLHERSGIQIHVEGTPVDPDLLGTAWTQELVPPGINVTTSHLDLRFGGDYYWGSLEKNLVYVHESLRVNVEIEGTDREGAPYKVHGSLVDDTIKRLLSHSLEVKPPREVPALDVRGASDSDTDRLDSLFIQTDRPLLPTPNVAEGAVSYAFSLESRSPWHPDKTAPGGRAYAGGETYPYNFTRFSIQWTLSGFGEHEPVATHDASTFAFALDRAGRYHVSAVLSDRALGLPVKTLGFDFRLDYQASNSVHAEPGLSGPLTLLRFPVDQPGGQAVIEWSAKGRSPTGATVDPGSYVLREPNGRRQTIEHAYNLFESPPGSHRFNLGGPSVGEYALEWQPALPVMVGEDHTARVSVTYPGHAELHGD